MNAVLQHGTDQTTPGSVPYVIEVDQDNANGGTSLAGTVSVNDANGGLPNVDSVTTHFRSNDGHSGPTQLFPLGVFGTGTADTNVTYDFGIAADADKRIIAGRDIDLTGPVSGKLVHVDAYTNILALGNIDVIANGDITVTEIAGDLKVGRIASVGRDVTLNSPRRIVDSVSGTANGDDSGATVDADVTGRNILMIAGDNGIGGEEGTGGIGTPDNFLEINVDVLQGAGGITGSLQAYDTAAGLAPATQGVFLTEVRRAGDVEAALGGKEAIGTNALQIHTVDTKGDASLANTSGSVRDARNNGTGDSAADVFANTVDIYANGGHIGDVSGSNDLDIDSQHSLAGDVGLRATGSIYLTETDSEPVTPPLSPDHPNRPNTTAYGLHLVLAETTDAGSDIRLTVRESADLDEDLVLTIGGSVLFTQNAPESMSNHNEIDSAGWVELRIGDDLVDRQGANPALSLAGNSVVEAAEWIDIFLDDQNADTDFGAHTTFLGTYRPGNGAIGGTAAHPHITRIFGHTDVDTLTFDKTDLDGKTEVYGSQDTDATGNDGEDRFTVDSLLSMDVTGGHTLTLDGQADTDYYTIYTTGSQASIGERRNYVVNILDKGLENDGVDEAFIYGVESANNGYADPQDITTKFPADDIFLMRRTQYIPSLQPGDDASTLSGPYGVGGVNMESADDPAFVALLHGSLAVHRDLVPNNAPPEDASINFVQRVNYDSALNGRLNVYGLSGNDYFASDDNSVTTQLDGGVGHDSFQIGQIFGSQRDDDAGPSLTPFNPLDAAAPEFGGALQPHDVFPKMVATTRGWLSPGISAPTVVTGGTGNDEFTVYANQAELRLEGDDDNDLFIVRAFALAAVVDTDANGDGLLDANDIDHPTVDNNGDGVVNSADAHTTFDTNNDKRINLLDGPNNWQDDKIVLDLVDGKYVARPVIGSAFSTDRPLDIRSGGGEDEVQYNVNAPVSIDGGTGFDKLVVLATEFADDIAITSKGIFGAGLNVRYTTVEVVEVDGLEGDDEFFVQSTEFGVAYRVIGGLGSDTINVTGDVTADIVARELEGASGTIDHLVTSNDPRYDGLPTDGIDYNVASGDSGLVVVEETGSGTSVTEGGEYALPPGVRLALDSYTVRLAKASSEWVYVTVSVARSPQEEADDILNNPPPLFDGPGDTMWITASAPGVDPMQDFRRHYDVDGNPHHEPSRAVVLAFAPGEIAAKTVYLYAVDDTRSEGDRVVVSQHSVISADADFNGVAVRNVEVKLRDNDTPGMYVTEVQPGTDVEDGRTLIIEGKEIAQDIVAGDMPGADTTDFTGLRDEILVELAKAPQAGDVIVVELDLDAASEREMYLVHPVGQPVDSRFQILVDGDVTRYFATFDASNWDDPVRVGIEARDDSPREDPGTAVINFVQHREDFTFAGVTFDPVDGADDADPANDLFVFPNLRSGNGLVDVEVIDNDSAGLVSLETGTNTQLVVDDLSTVIDESQDDQYTIRLTRQPGAAVDVAVLTDGLADIVSIGGVAINPLTDYGVIGGYVATQAFGGTITINNAAGGAVITRGAGSDLGSFIEEGFQVGQLVRVALTADEGETYTAYDTETDGSTKLTITHISSDGLSMTLSDSISGLIADADGGGYELSSIARLASRGEWTGVVDFTKVNVDGTDYYRMTRQDGSGWLADGFLEGQRFRITQGVNAGDYKIAIIRGDNESKDNTIELTLETPFANVGAAGADQLVTVKRTAALAHFTASDWYKQQDVVLQADPFFEVPLTREGVKNFPSSMHLLSRLRGPLAVEGGPTGADRSLQTGLKLPGEADAPLIEIGPQPPESRQIDVLNLFNDSSQEDLSGTMTQTTLRGLGMAEDLDFGPSLDPNNPQHFGEPTIFPGGVSFGSVAVVDGQFATDGAKSSIEVVNFLGGSGNDDLLIEGTLDPDVAVKGTGTFEAAAPGADPRFDADTDVVLSKAAWDWRAQGFLPGQKVTVFDYAGNTKGAVLGTFEVVAISDDDPLDTFNNTELQLQQLTGAALPLGERLVRIEAEDDLVVVTLPVTLAGTDDNAATDVDEEGGTITRVGGSWADDGFEKGQLLLIDGMPGSWRITDVTATVLSVRGNKLPDGASQRTLSVAGTHGGLTVVHGGGNFALELEPDINLGSNFVERRDGLDWQDDGYAVGQFITIEGLSGVWQIAGFDDAALASLSADIVSNPFEGAGTNSRMVLTGAPIGAQTNVVATAISVVDAKRVEADGAMSIATVQADESTFESAYSEITRASGNWIADGFYVGQQVYVSGLAGAFTVSNLTATGMRLQNVALTPVANADLTVFGYDTRGAGVRATGTTRMGGDTITVTGGAGPDSPLVVYGDTSQDGVWYSGVAGDVRGYEFGNKPFDPFTHLPDGDNENDEWVFALADAYDNAGNDVIDARQLFATVAAVDLPTVGFTAYGGEGDDLIYGSQAGDHLAGGSGDDEIHGNRGVDHIYGDSGINVDIFSRALHISTQNQSPKPTIDLDLISFTPNGTTVTPADSQVVDEMLVAGRDVIYGDGVHTTGLVDGPEFAYDDVIFGDHGAVMQNVADPNVPNEKLQKIQTTALDSILSIQSRNLQRGGDDVIFGNLGRDIIVAGAGHDMADGDEADDMVFGDNVTALTRMGGADGNVGDDTASLRFQTLAGTLLYSSSEFGATANGSGQLLVDGVARNYRDPDGAPWWAEYTVDYAALHNYSFDLGHTGAGSFGNDYVAGSEKHDLLFGQLGSDVVQGDGGIELAFAATSHVGASRTSGPVTDPVGPLSVVASVERLATDGQDYIEGGGGNDVIFGGLGQDDIVGGSSTFFSLATPEHRPDGDDIIFGGAGTQITRNNALNADGSLASLTPRHAQDADTIGADNADIVRIVGTNHVDINPQGSAALPLFLSFNYDNYDSTKIVVRGVTLLDYTPGGPDFQPALFSGGSHSEFGFMTQVDIGGNDEVHGEMGDDTVYLQGGNDIAFGDAEDDDLIGGWGSDWISGGTGQDGILGDDGRILTSRNAGAATQASFAEPLYGVRFLLNSDPDTRIIHGNVLNEFIYTPGNVQTATINVAGQLKKTVDLTPFNVDPVGASGDAQNPLFVPRHVNDIVFGGLGDDWLHGGSGDDALSGAEALPVSYTQRWDDSVVGEPVLVGVARSDFARPYNNGDALRFNPDDPTGWHRDRTGRSGEFYLYDEYDPRRKIELILSATNPALIGEAYEDQAGVTARGNFLLNFNAQYGAAGIGEGIARAGGVTPDGVPYLATKDDGVDFIFGDLGNDWLVGGTGKDDLYGGYGNDLLNADDYHDTESDERNNKDSVNSPFDNEVPDTQPFFEDRAYGGAGRDVIIGNTGGDRLIDWVGEFNTFLVPFAPFGTATVSRTLQPQLAEFLYALSGSDGVDMTRDTDTGAETARNGEPYGELGLLRQEDKDALLKSFGADFHSQTGAPADPQAGNIPGGKRDVLRSATFDNNKPENLHADSGTWQATGGVLQVAATSQHGDAVSVYQIGDALPSYFELVARIKTVKPTGGWSANSYVIFDYVGPQDFKFAGLDVSTNKLVIGHRNSNGWIVDKQAAMPGSVKADTWYDIMLSVNGLTATMIVGKASLSATYAARVDHGISYGLNWGLVGFGSNNSRGAMDNIAVQVVPPSATVTKTNDFSSGAAPMFSGPNTGTWTAASGRYAGTPPSGGYALSLMNISGATQVSTTSLLELSAKLSTSTRAGIVFDRYSDTDFKWAAIDAQTKQVLIGHYTTRSGWVTDAAVAKTITAGTDYTLGVTIKGATVSVTLNASPVVATVFNAIAADGRFGLFAKGGQASFDTVTVKTNDPSVPAAQTAAAGPNATIAVPASATLTHEQFDTFVTEAIRRWSLVEDASHVAALHGIDVVVGDLPGDALGEYADGRITIDFDAAGHGWFIDPTPSDDAEFAGDGRVLRATAHGGAAEGIDLLSVLSHEMGHAIGLGHSDSGVMEEQLLAGQRATPDLWYRTAATESGAERQRAGLEFDMPPAAPPAIDWNAAPVRELRPAAVAAALAPEVPAIKADAWQTRFVNHLGATPERLQANAGLKLHLPVAPRAASL
ncbi:MAG TPA: hypothetical protein VED01_10995 [Burkholderiales bacterium]|nr:hypothetical protein [Burkholderiales bacterium]